MGSLEGRVALITGAGRGIGRQEALYFAAEGAKVVVNDPGVAADGTGSDKAVAEQVVEEIIARGGQAVANTDSVADWHGAERMVKTALDTFGDLHIVVNNASITRNRGLIDLTEDDFDAVIAVKLKGSFAVTRWAARYWREQFASGARVQRAVVNTTSGQGLFNPLPGVLSYVAGNAGVAMMTIVEALELGRYGVRVNAIAPSLVRTRLTSDLPGMREELPEGSFDPRHPISQAPVAAYLAGADCPFTGQVLSVQGGIIIVDHGWSQGERIEKNGLWTVAELAERLPALPMEDPFDKLATAIEGAMGAGGRARMEQLIDSLLEQATT